MSGARTPTRVVVFLHGHGDTPDEYVRLAPQFLPAGAELVAPVGPRAVDGGTHAWFEPGPDGGPVAAQLEAALASVSATVEAACDAYETLPEHVVVAGFSQGGAVALAWALREGSLGRGQGPRVGGVCCVAGWLPDAEGLELDLAHPVEVPFLIAHGDDDEAVPLPMGRSVLRVLERTGWPVTFAGGAHGHEVAPFAGAIRSWLDARP